MMNRSELIGLAAEIMVDHGEIISLGDGCYEDMGGHIIGERDLESYFENFLKHLGSDERKSILSRVAGDE